jgi:hypothetical protein
MFGRDGDMGENTEAESGSREVFASISQRVTGGKGASRSDRGMTVAEAGKLVEVDCGRPNPMATIQTHAGFPPFPLDGSVPCSRP